MLSVVVDVLAGVGSLVVLLTLISLGLRVWYRIARHRSRRLPTALS